jgi:hypothetical protein
MSNDPHRHRAASSDVPAWQCRLRTLGYGAFFPLLVVVAVGYTVGLGLLLR